MCTGLAYKHYSLQAYSDACCVCLAGVDVLAQGQQAGVQNDEDAAAAAWGEEMEVLEAIYADAMQVTGERSVQASRL